MAKTATATPEMIGGVPVLSVDETDSYVNIMIYGDPGVGKTVLAGSADNVLEMSPVLFIDIEGGTLSLRQFYPGVKVVRAPTWEKLQAIYNDLYMGDHEYKTVVIDSLTEAQKFSMTDIMHDAYMEDDEDKVDPDVPGIRQWGKNIEQIRRLVRGFRDLPMNTIFTALAVSDKDNRNRRKLKPSFNGKLKDEVAGFLDVVCYYYIKEVDDEQTRLLLTEATDEQTAKDRSNRLPPVVVEPTMEVLHGLITGTLDKEDFLPEPE